MQLANNEHFVAQQTDQITTRMGHIRSQIQTHAAIGPREISSVDDLAALLQSVSLEYQSKQTHLD